MTSAPWLPGPGVGPSRKGMVGFAEITSEFRSTGHWGVDRDFVEFLDTVGLSGSEATVRTAGDEEALRVHAFLGGKSATFTMKVRKIASLGARYGVHLEGLQELPGRAKFLAFRRVEKGAIVVVEADAPSVESLAPRYKEAFLGLRERPDVPSPEGMEEVLDQLREVCRRGPIESLRDGATGVGYTLEQLLGIPTTSSRKSMLRGIGIKATRADESVTNKLNLFSRVPDWSRSRYQSPKELLDTFGYRDAGGGSLRLFHSLAAAPNSMGMRLEVRRDLGDLFAVQEGQRGQERLVAWPLPELEQRLSQRSAHSLLVRAKATRRNARGSEVFHYNEVLHLRPPIVGNLVPLLELGAVSVDFTISEREGGTVRDHGYLFKVRPEHMELLFPAPVRIPLC